MRTGYRVGWPEESVAWKALDFEYNDLENAETLDEVAAFLHIPKTTWPDVLAAFKARYGDIDGTWLTHTPQAAIRYYGDFHGADPRTYDLGDVYKFLYDPANIVEDLGEDGFFVLKADNVEDYEYKPRGYRKERDEIYQAQGFHYYHATPADNLSSILRDGLKPQNGMIYMSETIESSKQYVKDILMGFGHPGDAGSRRPEIWVMLVLSLHDLTLDDFQRDPDSGERNYYVLTQHAIPPSHVSFVEFFTVER